MALGPPFENHILDNLNHMVINVKYYVMECNVAIAASCHTAHYSVEREKACDVYTNFRWQAEMDNCV